MAWQGIVDMTEQIKVAQLHPAWCEAVREFLLGDTDPGRLVTHEWLYEAFRLEQPGPTTPYEVANKAQLAFLKQFKPFEGRLLVEHKIALRSVLGAGYEVVEPGEQTQWAQRTAGHDINKTLRKTAARLLHVNRTMLTAAQRRENDDAISRLSRLRHMIRKARPWLTDGQT